MLPLIPLGARGRRSCIIETHGRETTIGTIKSSRLSSVRSAGRALDRVTGMPGAGGDLKPRRYLSAKRRLTTPVYPPFNSLKVTRDPGDGATRPAGAAGPRRLGGRLRSPPPGLRHDLPIPDDWTMFNMYRRPSRADCGLGVWWTRAPVAAAPDTCSLLERTL